MWWIRSPERLKAEVTVIDELAQRESWLTAVTKRLAKNLNFAIDFDITVNDEAIALTLAYPAFFPETPPTVVPRDGRRLSGHQYGAGGELCLDYRSDNWDPAVTGAMMIESAYRLLAGEQPSPGERAVVPSAHHSSLGQQLRGVSCRFLLTPGLRDYLAGLRPGDCHACNVAEIFGPKKTWTAYVTAVGALEAPAWRESGIPARDEKGAPALLLRVASLADISITDQDSLDRLIADAAGTRAVPANDNATSRFAVVADAASAQLYFSFLNDCAWTMLPYRTIDLTDDMAGRLLASYTALAGKKVGLVGCGSLGSKIATSLARSGVGAFVLVDDDIMKPGNLIRHDLDAASLGAHKVDAMEARLKAVAPNVSVSARRVSLGGQESSGTTASVLDELATCDLLIDATADPAGVQLRRRRRQGRAPPHAVGGSLCRGHRRLRCAA